MKNQDSVDCGYRHLGCRKDTTKKGHSTGGHQNVPYVEAAFECSIEQTIDYDPKSTVLGPNSQTPPVRTEAERLIRLFQSYFRPKQSCVNLISECSR